MLERLILTVTIIGSLALLYGIWHYYKARLIRTIQSDGPAPGKPTLLYFTGQYCTACKLQQTPIVEKIRARLGQSIAIQTYDVSTHPDIADRYRVLTLPTTVVLDKQGGVKAINYGVTAQGKLEAQLL
jgi:thiol-disulfide isomerase/thioredoxin